MHKDVEQGTVDVAAAVLDAGWTGRHTVPATGLYPHQWSWDSAFVAIGARHREPARARAELVTLLDAQWADGRLPQIVYDVGRDDDYAPGADFWGTTAASGAATSGLVQPPVHAWAAWLVLSVLSGAGGVGARPGQDGQGAARRRGRCPAPGALPPTSGLPRVWSQRWTSTSGMRSSGCTSGWTTPPGNGFAGRR